MAYYPDEHGGHDPKTLAAELGLHEKTVRGHLRRCFGKLPDQYQDNWLLNETSRRRFLQFLGRNDVSAR